MTDKPKHTGRTTTPPIIQAQDIIARAKEAAAKQAEKLSNPPVTPGTRRTDVRIGVCGVCFKQKTIGSLSGTCHKCFWEGVEKMELGTEEME
jgi:hypothetical protein